MFCSGIAVAICIDNNAATRCVSITTQRRNKMEQKFDAELEEIETCNEEPQILEEIQVEELAIDGICGVY
jgi:mycofactocin precursor